MRVQKPSIPVETEEKTNLLIKIYPKYKLYGRIWKKDIEEYNRTQDRSLFIYTFCKNERNKKIPDYLEIIAQAKRDSKEEYLQQRLSQGFKGT